MALLNCPKRSAGISAAAFDGAAPAGGVAFAWSDVAGARPALDSDFLALEAEGMRGMSKGGIMKRASVETAVTQNSPGTMRGEAAVVCNLCADRSATRVCTPLQRRG